MKYVASMKMEHCATPEGLEKLLHSLELYLQEHPPIADETFTNMSEIAKSLGNDKLVEQCLTAQNRCLETQKMLTLRGNTLQQFRDQLEQDVSDDAARTKSSSALSSKERNTADTCKYSSTSAVPQPNIDIKSVPSSGLRTNPKSHWEPRDTSTPVVPKTYSRTLMEKLKKSTSLSSTSSSPASSPSHSIISPCSPSHSSLSSCHSTDSSPAHSFIQPRSPAHSLVQPRNFQGPISGYQDQNNGSIYGANVTQTGTDSSKENLLDSDQRIFLVPNIVSSQNLTDFKRGGNLNSVPSKNVKQALQRAISPPHPVTSSPIMEEDQGAVSESPSNSIHSLRQNGRTNSMITGSSDSLPR